MNREATTGAIIIAILLATVMTTTGVVADDIATNWTLVNAQTCNHIGALPCDVTIDSRDIADIAPVPAAPKRWFEPVYAIAGLLAIAYLVLKRR